MYINNKNYMLDNLLYEDIQRNYQENLNNFKIQNTALIINNVKNLNEYDIIKFVDDNLGKNLEESDIYIDNRFINEHFLNFAINPVIEELNKNYTIQVDIIPDIICEVVK